MSTELPPAPQVSPDGKFYWDGQRWVPMPQAPVAPQPVAVAPPTEVMVRGQMPSWVAVVGLVLCLPIGLLMVGFTRWSLGTKVGVGIAAVVGWVIFLASVNHH